MYGILLNVYVNIGGRYHRRPHPQPLYNVVVPLVAQDDWSSAAERMCEAESDADMEPPVPVHEDDTETAAALAELRSVTGPQGRARKA
eukprot:1196861-Pyramimonas_sp.AAC.1